MRSRLHRLAVDVQHAVDHLDAVAGQADHALDVVGGVVLRQPEHHDVAALGLAEAPIAAGEQRRRQRQRIMAVAVGVFRHEQVVADQQRRLHRAGRNVERLEQEGADDERDDAGVDQQPDEFADAAFFALCSAGHAHRPLVPGRRPAAL